MITSLRGLDEGVLQDALRRMYPKAQKVSAHVTLFYGREEYHLSVQFPDMPEHTCTVTRPGMEMRPDYYVRGSLGLYIHERLGKPAPKPPPEPKPPSGVREPYSCGHCGAPVAPDVKQCGHCKAWLMPAQGRETKRKKRRSKPPPMKLPPSPRRVLL